VEEAVRANSSSFARNLPTAVPLRVEKPKKRVHASFGLLQNAQDV
jgi:hypothetical protein